MKNKKTILRKLLLVLAIFSFISCKTTEIFLSIGQSNMAGRGEMVATDTIPQKNIFLFNDKDEWEPAKNPLNRYSTIRKKMSMQKLGPSWSFAQTLADTDKKVGLVVNVKGGTRIDQWKKGGEFYNEAVKRTLKAQEKGVLKGIIWHQGEGDRGKWEAYTQKFTDFITHLRKDLNAPNVPVIIGEIGNWRGTSDSINKVLLNLKKHVENLGAVKATDLMHKGDSVHFDRASQIILGKRYAEKYLELTSKNKD